MTRVLANGIRDVGDEIGDLVGVIRDPGDRVKDLEDGIRELEVKLGM